MNINNNDNDNFNDIYYISEKCQQTDYPEKDSKKEICKDNGGEWENGACDSKKDNEVKVDEFLDDVQKIEKLRVRTALEEK